MKSSTFTSCFTAFFATVSAVNFATYPQVPKTASINGFADPIFAELPECAQDCVELSTGNTPCPYWDTGCLCVMPQWSGKVAQCFAKSCDGADVYTASSLAMSLCSSVGANHWVMPATISSEINQAKEEAKTTSSGDESPSTSAGSSVSTKMASLSGSGASSTQQSNSSQYVSAKSSFSSVSSSNSSTTSSSATTDSSSTTKSSNDGLIGSSVSLVTGFIALISFLV